VNGDGVDDLLLEAAGLPGVQLVLGGPTARTGFAGGPASYGFTGGLCGAAPTSAQAIGDIDGDGLMDLLFEVDGCAPAVLFGASLPAPIPGARVDVDLAGGDLTIEMDGDWTVHDLDGDAFADLLVLGHEYGGGSYGVYGFFGSALSGRTTVGLADAAFAVDDSGAEQFVRAASSVVDVDGDGVREIAVSASMYAFNASTFPLDNAVYIHHSSSLTPGVVATQVDAQQEIRDTFGAYDWFGSRLVPGGDFDGDGVEDLVLSGMRGVETAHLPPAVHVVSGAQLALGGDIDIEVDATTLREDGTGRGIGEWVAADDQVMFGDSVARLGDLDGDGFGDYVVTNFPEWQYQETFVRHVTVFSGRDLVWGDRLTLWQADYFIPVTGWQYDTVENLGDIDGDGHVDLRVADTVVWGPLLP